MARADTYTWLPLDEWAMIMGINPVHWNQLSSPIFNNNVCGEIFFQQDWHHSDRIGRDTVARAIREAELEMALEAGFNLLPDWTSDERLYYAQPAVPGSYHLTGANPRGMLNSIELRKGHIISGGQRAKVLIQSGAVVVRSDVDGDTFQETATVTVPVTFTDTNQIRIYYPTKSGADTWEVRPITVAISGGFATIQFKIWQLVAASQMDRLDAQPLDADLAASYETTVDVYQVYNDPSVQVSFVWENNGPLGDCCGSCMACTLGTQTGCFHNREDRLGIIVPAPAAWDAQNSEFTAQEWSACRAPDQLYVNYYSGWRDWSVARPYVELSPYWKTAIAYYAASKLDRPVCGCSNISQFVDKWRRDAAFSSQEEGGWTMTPEMASNRLGTTMGALYAYRAIHKAGIRVTK
jgi:hypothetical protein